MFRTQEAAVLPFLKGTWWVSLSPAYGLLPAEQTLPTIADLLAVQVQKQTFPGKVQSVSSWTVFLLPRVSLWINISALIRKEMNGFTQTSCNLRLQISLLKYLFPWDALYCWLFVWVVFIFWGEWHAWGLLYMKVGWTIIISENIFYTWTKCLYLFTYSIQLFGGFLVFVWSILHPFSQISIDKADHLDFFSSFQKSCINEKVHCIYVCM